MNVFFYTLGCKVNQYETAAMKRLFEQAGFSIAQTADHADCVVVNSCTVTASGDNKSLRCLRRAKRENPQCITVLCGCYAQVFLQQSDMRGDSAGADIIVGTKNKTQLPQLVLRFAAEHNRINTVCRHAARESFEDMPVTDMGARTRAFMKIQDGCERYCAYCVVPFARGPVRSMDIQAVRRQAQVLAQSGYREVVLAGINLCFYGREWGLTLADAVDAVCEPEKVCRVRLSSVEPDMLSEEVLRRLAGQPKLCAHFHMSLQSGCEQTLRRMGRKYTPQEFIRTAQLIRELFANPTFTTDIIVGFPGETEEEFEQSLRFVSEFGFLKCHVFPYSRREGTAAASFPDQISEEVKKRRAKLMSEAGEKSRAKLLQGYVGTVQTVIAEAPNEQGLLTGYTAGYIPVVICKAGTEQNELVTGTITRIEGDSAVLE